MSLRQKRTAVVLLFLAVVLLSGCASRVTATPTAVTAQSPIPNTPTPRPTLTPTSTATVTAILTSTLTPTPSPLPNTPTPTPSPSPTTEAGTETSEPAATVRFARDIAPIFQQRCVKCHAGAGAPRGLRLDTYEHVMKGGDFRPVVVPGDPEGSELVRRIRGDSTPRMPFDGPPFLSDEEIAKIVQWIKEGAPDN